jgi:hypothetical protein
LTSFSDWIINLNILPIRHGETRYYSFVPPKFIRQTISVISGLFNFHIRVPGHSANPTDENDNHIYCIMYSDSLTVGSNQVSFNNALPKYCLHGYGGNALVEDRDSSTADVCANTYDFGYSLILVSDSMTGDPSLGYVNTYFPNAIYSHMFSEDLLYVYSGYIWDPEFTLENIRNDGEKVFDDVNMKSTAQVGFNKLCKVPKATNNFGYKKLFYTVNRVNKNSIQSNGNDEISGYWNSTFPNITIV